MAELVLYNISKISSLVSFFFSSQGWNNDVLIGIEFGFAVSDFSDGFGFVDKVLHFGGCLMRVQCKTDAQMIFSPGIYTKRKMR